MRRFGIERLGVPRRRSAQKAGVEFARRGGVRFARRAGLLRGGGGISFAQGAALLRVVLEYGIEGVGVEDAVGL